MSAAANIRIEAINSPQAFEEFARLPYQVYADREAWWPPDIRNEVDLLSGRTLTAPYLDLQPFCAWSNGRLVARVSAVINRRYISHWGQRLGQLIHFEAAADEDDAVGAMLRRAMEWLVRGSMKSVRSGFAAFLDYPYAIDNYGGLPSFLLRGNPEYYHRYLKDAGFETEKGQIDYTAALTPDMLARYARMIEAARAAGVAVMSWREYGFLAAVDAWTEVTNAAFARHWGWNPITRDEVRPDDGSAARYSGRRSFDGRGGQPRDRRGGLFGARLESGARADPSGRQTSSGARRRHARCADQYRSARVRTRQRRGARDGGAIVHDHGAQRDVLCRLHTGARRQLALAPHGGRAGGAGDGEFRYLPARSVTADSLNGEFRKMAGGRC